MTVFDDVSELALPTDEVDPELTRRPAHWDIGMIGRFMLVFGPASSLYDFITFGLMRLIPGDVSAALAGVSATPAEREQIRHNLGLDQPVQVQLVRWYSDLLRGDLGRSLFLGKPVTQATFERLPVSLSISAYSLVLTLVLGLASGILAAMRQNRFAAHELARQRVRVRRRVFRHFTIDLETIAGRGMTSADERFESQCSALL